MKWIVFAFLLICASVNAQNPAATPNSTPWTPLGCSLNQPQRAIGGKVFQQPNKIGDGLIIVFNEDSENPQYYWLTGLNAQDGICIKGHGIFRGKHAWKNPKGEDCVIDSYEWRGGSLK